MKDSVMLAVDDHIEVDASGIARIAGTRIKVHQLIQDHKAWGWNAPELHAQFPHLSLGQIHAAFVYYYDHTKEIDAQIAQSDAQIAASRATLGGSQPSADELRSRHQP